jgi:hypothetical protein
MAAAAAVFAMAASVAVAGQYQWRDAQGRMVYSDLPPPASVPAARVVKAPAAALSATSASPSSSSGAAPAAAASLGSPGATGTSRAATPAAQSIADRDLAFRKRQADLAEAEKKAQEAAGRKLELAKACSDAQGDIRSMQSGQRISRIAANGEREFVSDRERAERLEVARKSVREHC